MSDTLLFTIIVTVGLIALGLAYIAVLVWLSYKNRSNGGM